VTDFDNTYSYLQIYPCPRCNGATKYGRIDIANVYGFYGYFCPNCSWDESYCWLNEEQQEPVDYSDGF
jgi:hypothetical protein